MKNFKVFASLVLAVATVSTLSAETRYPANVAIPFRLYNGNLIVVKATIGTIKNVNMILDTGTNRSIISKELASRLKMSEGSEPIETLNGTLQVKSLKIGRAHV